MFGFQDDVTLVSCIPKKNKNILFALSMHFDDAIDETTGEAVKAEIITFYNLTKGGVDTLDQLRATYDVARNTRRWPMVIFYSLLNVAGMNSQIIYINNDPTTTCSRREYLKEVALT